MPLSHVLIQLQCATILETLAFLLLLSRIWDDVPHVEIEEAGACRSLACFVLEKASDRLHFTISVSSLAS
jgi:hypothetical protein